ncbi:MAG: (2Fe-2S)-binding protein [Nitrospirota bacterium]
MKRRGFLKACAGLAALAAAPAPGIGRALAQSQGVLRKDFPRAALVDQSGRPIAAAALKGQTNYVFLYPFSETPCFLVDLGEPIAPAPLKLKDGTEYAWPGGAGPKKSIVAYMAVCTHSFSHPEPEVAMIKYYGPEEKGALAGRGNVITCCVHASIFDPAKGAEVIQAPAEIPLTTVLLEWDPKSDALSASGLLGRDVMKEFFEAFPQKRQEPVGKESRLVTLDAYSKIVIGC